MARNRDPYAPPSGSVGPYPSRTEIDLRQEFNNMFDGIYPEIAKAQPYLLRKFRRGQSMERIACECVDRLTKEADRDTWCPVCHGEGYLWDEIPIQVYRQSVVRDATGTLNDVLKEPGIQNIDRYSFWFKSSMPVTKQDKIVGVVLDEEGNFAEPIRRKELWRISLLLDLRADNGRLEFWQAHCYAEKRTFLNGPVRNKEEV